MSLTDIQLAKTLWDYHRMNHDLRKSDVIIVLGSHDTRVAERGAELLLSGLAPLIVFSGYLGALTDGVWTRAEAEIFADVARGMGVSEERILIENRATNTGENVMFSRALLAERGIYPQSVLAVQKPYMERRTWATFRKRWPEPVLTVTSPQYSFEEYLTEEITAEKVTGIMVGDLQRIMLYPEKGYQVYQEVPPHVRQAFDTLVERGYTGHLAEKPTVR